MRSILSKFLVCGAVVAACVGGVAVPASALPQGDWRAAKASGTINATDIDLTDGTFHSDNKLNIRGDLEVRAGDSTSFQAVLGYDPTTDQVEQTPYTNQARMEWSYQIVDGGRETGLWVAGVSINYTSELWPGHKWSWDGWCAVYDSNPLEDQGRLDDAPRPVDSPYVCSARGELVHDYWFDSSRNDHFRAKFTIARK